MFTTIEFWIGVAVSSIGLVVYRWLINIICTDGTLAIDQSNPEKDVYRLNIDDLDRLLKKKRIVLKVDSKADLSQK